MPTLYSRISLTLCLFAATVLSLGTSNAAPASSSMVQAPMASSVQLTPGISGISNVTDHLDAPVITTRLVANHGDVTPGQTIQLAWEFKLNPHWHIYWNNPGDSGLPPQLMSTMGGNTTAQALTWPTPKVISIPPVTNYGYEDAVTFTSNFTVPTGLAQGPNVLPFKASFLYCNEICLPGEVELKLPLTIGSKAVANSAFKPSSNVPQTLPSRSNLVAESTGQTVQLTLPLNLTGPNIRFIPAEDGVIDDSASQTLTGNVLSIQLDPQAENAPDNLNGLLLINGQGYSFSTPLHQGASTTSVTPPQSNADASQISASFVGAIFFAFLAGLILNLMPCVLPVLSLKLLSLVKHHHGPSRVQHTVAYTLGVLASFWVFAIVIAFIKGSGTQLGWGFHLQNPMLVAGLVLLLFTTALNFFGIFELGAAFTRLGAKPSTSGRPSVLASAATGVLAVVVATPCTVPFMGGAMAYALTRSLAESLVIFTALGLGMALPFLIAIPFPQVFKWLPKPGKWMSTFRHALGWPMLATALWLTYVFASQTDQFATFMLLTLTLLLALALWVYGTRPHKRMAALPVIVVIVGMYLVSNAVTRQQIIVWQPFSVAAVEQARKSGNPVFVDFTADWCLTCKVTEATVLNTEKTQRLFAHTKTTLFMADWTNQNPEITAELARHGRKGVPLYLLYMPNEEAEILPQLITYSLLKEKLVQKYAPAVTATSE
ncbi:MAG: hypothetical protein EON60_00470 [Alphaproteobacteria bacterium]|nr:MAG: hypothetical protein EON60_00470 [Alphaproteobacteria bacterium]